MTRTFTGWHMLALMIGGFGTIIAVNLVLAYQAVATFPGLETRNSYVASQHFDADRAAQDALGWTVLAELSTDMLAITVQDGAGNPVRAEVVKATLGRATHTGEDTAPALVWDGVALRAPVAVAPGYWNLRLELRADDGTLFRRRFPLRAK